MNKKLIEKIAPQLTELMIKKMETLTEEWRKRGSPTSRTVFRATCAARPTGAGIS